MRNFKYEIIPIEDLYINPENYRYINDAEDEIDAILLIWLTETSVKDDCETICNYKITRVHRSIIYLNIDYFC